MARPLRSRESAVGPPVKVTGLLGFRYQWRSEKVAVRWAGC